ncbi:MAG TPA: FmdB family zinc ribbon protein [Vicinamibacterales bacterium]|jgi:putative FmdB family regulatory protein|nr:FmdB family zinc ribbon protein [Vicinamibacterales bacterium]
MPLYEYQCDGCGERFEVIQKFSDPPVETCSACGGPVKKLLSSPAIQFKGSGWYITDYARKSGDAAKSGDGTTSSTDGSKPAASGDAKTSTSTTTSDTGTSSSSSTKS